MSRHFVIDMALGPFLDEFLPTRPTDDKYVAAYNEEPPVDAIPPRTENATTTEPYVYKALAAPSPGELRIRLLSLLPGSKQSDICATLSEAALSASTAGTYEALSYVWGDVSDRTPIDVNGRTLHIGRNLRAALLYLRHESEPRTLWIDAVCIDQADAAERAGQVAGMGRIYAGAARTVVWLGEEESATRDAFRALRVLALEAGEVEREGGGRPEVVKARAGHAYELLKRDASVIDAVLWKPWWRRAWTAQEIILVGGEGGLLVSGNCTMPWDAFSAAVAHGLRLGVWDTLHLGTFVDPSFAPIHAVNNIRQLLLSRRRLQESRSVADRRESLAATTADDLFDVLVLNRFRDCSDASDKVFSVLGLFEASGGAVALGIRPDYTLPAATVYRSAARRLVAASGSLDVLGACFPASPRSRLLPSRPVAGSPILPSWVPDWSYPTAADSAPRPLAYDALGRRRGTSACGGRRTTAHGGGVSTSDDDDDDGVLVLSAHALATVAAVAAPLPSLDYTLWGRGVASDSDEEKPLSGHLRDLGALLTELRDNLLAVAPYMGVFLEWEAFARKWRPDNPDRLFRPPPPPPPPPKQPSSPPPGDAFADVAARFGQAVVSTVASATETTAKWLHLGKKRSPDDDAAVAVDPVMSIYWQTLCAGTLIDPDSKSADPASSPSSSSFSPSNPSEPPAQTLARRYAATSALFLGWRATLSPIRSLRSWRADKWLGRGGAAAAGLAGYLRSTWTDYGAFAGLVGMTAERRLGGAVAAGGQLGGGRRFLCLLPRDAEEGDLVVLASGGKVPLVLRPVPEREDGSPCYEFVGEAYVHGVMDGEAFKDDECRDMYLR